MLYDNLSSVSQNVLKFYQQLTDEERRIAFIFDDFHFCHSRVIGLDVTENRIFTLCRMITLVVFLRMFWNVISSLLVKRGWSLSFLVGTISNVLVMEIGWTDVGSGGYISAHSNTSFNCRYHTSNHHKPTSLSPINCQSVDDCCIIINTLINHHDPIYL